MSSFWNLFGKDEKPPAEDEGEPADEQPAAKPSTAPKQQGQPSPASTAPKQPAALEGKPPPPVLPPARTAPRYGIDEAIRLMRTLPVDDNPDLVVRVIKRTLESLSVKVPDIIDDAAKRQESLRTKISEHQAAIVQLEREIDTRRFDIGRLEDELAETTQVRERLQLAEQLPVTPNAPRVAPQGSAVITGGSNPPPPSAQKKPPLPTTFRPKPTATDVKKTEAPSKADEKKDEKRDEKKEERKDEPEAPKASRESKSDADDDDDEPVESRDMIDKS